MKTPFLLPLLLGALLAGFSTSAPYTYEDEPKYVNKIKDWIRHKDDEQKNAEKSEESNKVESADDSLVPKPGELFEGDIVMDEDLRNAVVGKTDKRSAIINHKKLWPGAVLPYEFEDSVSPNVRQHIRRVMRDFHKYTCIRLVERTNEKAYIIIRTHPNSCSSFVGRRRRSKPQHVTLAYGCMRRGTILHELSHALGIVHEQSRLDRDQYINVVWSNIRRREWHNFKKYSWTLISSYGVSYNFNSIMHYGPYAFSRNGEKTILPVSRAYVRYGQRKRFSAGDVETLNRLYGCYNHKHFTKRGLLPSNDGKHLQYAYPSYNKKET